MEPITKRGPGRPAGSKLPQTVGKTVLMYVENAKDYAKEGAMYYVPLSQGVMPHSKLLRLVTSHTAASVNQSVAVLSDAGVLGVIKDAAPWGCHSGRAYWAKTSPDDEPPVPIDGYPEFTSQAARKLRNMAETRNGRAELADVVVGIVMGARTRRDPQYSSMLEIGFMPRSVLIRLAKMPADVLDVAIEKAVADQRITPIDTIRDVNSKRNRTCRVYVPYFEF